MQSKPAAAVAMYLQIAVSYKKLTSVALLSAIFKLIAHIFL